MKFIKYLLIIIGLLIFLFLLLGIMKPSVEYGHEITVDKSAVEAWAVHQDKSKYSQWLEGFKSMERLTGEEGEVGSTYKIIVNPGDGQEDFEMTETLVSIDPADHVTVNMDSEMMVFDQTTTFTESDGKTTIKTDSEVKGKGMMMRSMFALMSMGGSFQKQEEKHLEALKTLINENTTDYFPKPEQTVPQDSVSTDSI